jgi:hypothetical protein
MSISFSALLAVEVQYASTCGFEEPIYFFDKDLGICFIPVFDKVSGEHYAFASAGRVYRLVSCGYGQVSLMIDAVPENIILMRKNTDVSWIPPLSRIMFGEDMVPESYVVIVDGVRCVCDYLSFAELLEPVTG